MFYLFMKLGYLLTATEKQRTQLIQNAEFHILYIMLYPTSSHIGVKSEFL